MKVKFFIDTNIIIYSFDSQSLDKESKEQPVIQRTLTGIVF